MTAAMEVRKFTYYNTFCQIIFFCLTFFAIKGAVRKEKEVVVRKLLPKIDYQTLPTKAYLDNTVVPILLQGLSTLSKERYELFL